MDQDAYQIISHTACWIVNSIFTFQNTSYSIDIEYDLVDDSDEFSTQILAVSQFSCYWKKIIFSIQGES